MKTSKVSMLILIVPKWTGGGRGLEGTGWPRFVIVLVYERCGSVCQVDPSCSLILAGFSDGVVRLLMVQKMEGVDQYGRRVADKSELILKQVLRPHKINISAIAIDSCGELLATGVSCFMTTSASVKPWLWPQSSSNCDAWAAIYSGFPQLLESPGIFSSIFQAWKVLEKKSGPRTSLNFIFEVLEIH